MQRIRTVVAVLLAIVWLPAVSCCLIDASGLIGEQDCCSKEHSHSASGPGNCDQPCGALASASYLPQQGQLLPIAPIGEPLAGCGFSMRGMDRPAGLRRDFPATAPPELAGQWQFSFRTAPSPRAPSFAS